ncbi:MAG: DUF4783 domain-containing protein [Bacteroidota bacterium]
MDRKKVLLLALLFLLGIVIGMYFKKGSDELEIDQPPPTQQGSVSNIPETYDQSDDVLIGFNRGEAEKLRPYLGEEVELTLLEEEDILSAEEAMAKLASFFDQHPADGFRLRHRGQSGGGDNSYLIGNFRSGTKSFRTYLNFYKEKIVEIRMEDE